MSLHPILSHQRDGSATSLNWSGYASFQTGTHKRHRPRRRAQRPDQRLGRNRDSIVMQTQSGITKADPSALGSTGNGFHVDRLHN
jgi:hypothetical protein